MDSSDMYEAMKHAFIDAMATREPPPRLIRIEPFDAVDEDDAPARVVGIYDDEDMMKFVVIAQEEDGEIYPIVRTNVYRKSLDST